MSNKKPGAEDAIPQVSEKTEIYREWYQRNFRSKPGEYVRRGLYNTEERFTRRPYPASGN